MTEPIRIRGLRQNNLKNISLDIPKDRIVVFTGVSGSGKSSIVFDTVAAESQRQMNETYSAWIRGRLPKYERPDADLIENLNASVIVDQKRLGGNSRSTVGTITDLYAKLRLLYSRISEPSAGSASNYSFNDPNGMCQICSGIGKVMDLDIEMAIDPDKSFNESMLRLPAFSSGNYYWKLYVGSGLFDPDKKYRDYSEEERNLLLFGSRTGKGEREHKKVEGIKNMFQRLCLMKSPEEQNDRSLKRLDAFMHETVCPGCGGRRLNQRALASKVRGFSIDEMCALEFRDLRNRLSEIGDPRVTSITEEMVSTLDCMIGIGLPYLSLDRESSTLSGGEAQRLKMVRYMGSSLTGMTYIFDEPSVGMHPRDVSRITALMKDLRDKGNTVLIVEHDRDVISIADEIVDIGPGAGSRGGEVVFQGTYGGLLESGTVTGRALGSTIPVNSSPRTPSGWMHIRNACIHNLRNVDADIPEGVLTVVTGVAGSGKSSLIRDEFTMQNPGRIILVDQSPVTATGRSTVCTYLGFFDDIRREFARRTGGDPSLFSFNSKGACPVCGGRGTITTELVFMDPVTTVCESCGGSRYSDLALGYAYDGRTITDILEMSVEEASEFFRDSRKISAQLDSLMRTGLEYISLGQPLSTLSGGERQRVKLAKHMKDKGNVYVLDEPTTGLHASDVSKLMDLFGEIVDHGNTMVIIEHNTDVMKMADYIIDVGPDGGSSGGEVVFTGTPAEMVAEGATITAEYLRRSV